MVLAILMAKHSIVIAHIIIILLLLPLLFRRATPPTVCHRAMNEVSKRAA